jgi:hypothetical protein
MRAGMIDTQAIRQRWESVGSKLDERGRRVFAAGEVRATGWGGLEVVSEITGLARSTIGRGLKDLDAAPLPKGRVRRKGGGRRHLSSRDATLIEDLRNVIEPATLGDPMRPLSTASGNKPLPSSIRQDIIARTDGMRESTSPTPMRGSTGLHSAAVLPKERDYSTVTDLARLRG